MASPTLPARWADILDSVLQALAQAEADAARSAQGLDAVPADPPSPDWERHLTELNDQAQRLDACTANADLAAGAVDATLQASETALRQWLAQAEAIRRKLATRADLSV
jgi:hypothetical protein